VDTLNSLNYGEFEAKPDKQTYGAEKEVSN
jgi:hypothetical protein